MARHVDGFVIPVSKRKVKAYLRQAKLGARVWKEHGALAYVEAVGDDLDVPFGKGFRKLAGLEPGETVVSFILFKSRKHRDQVNAKAMNDPRLNDPAIMGPMAFDARRFATGGFAELVGW